MIIWTFHIEMGISKSFVGNINEMQYKYLDSLSIGLYDEELEIFQF